MPSFLVTCYSVISAFYPAISQERVSNRPQRTTSRGGDVSVQCILQKGTKQAAREESAHKRPNTPAELVPQGDVGQKVCSLLSCIWGAPGGQGSSVILTPFLPLLSFSVWFSLCPVVGISVSKHEPFECILIILVVVLFKILLHYYNNSENVHCLYP